MTSGSGDPLRPARRRTRVVRVGGIEIGGDHPIRIQSMTNTDTMDTRATVRQIIALAEAGCEIVRVTAPSIREAENLREIRRRLQESGIDIPLVADIHFTPNAAMIAAEIVEKVRINPGNYADKKKFEVREYDDVQYAAEVERVAERFRPLVLRCKARGVAMRIGTNHGSLSDRIMNRFGDTALGMVESALEFLDVCEAEGYRDVIFSMKASNTQVAIAAYRLLAERLEERAPGVPSYPFHVGVTEAGGAEDGRIKSAIGIGSLLEDGLGDTIRVSLTEDPVREVPVARAIAERAGRLNEVASKETEDEGARKGPPRRSDRPRGIASDRVDARFAPRRRTTDRLRWGGLEVGDGAPVRVELEVGDVLSRPAESAAGLAVELSGLKDVACESLLVSLGDVGDPGCWGEFAHELASLGVELPISLRVGPGAADLPDAIPAAGGLSVGRIVTTIDATTRASEILRLAELAGKSRAGMEWELACAGHEMPLLVERVLANRSGETPPAMSVPATASLHAVRALVVALSEAGAARTPIVLRQRVAAAPSAGGAVGDGTTIPEAALIDASVRLGSLLCDGIGDAVSMVSTIGAAPAVDLAYRILQGARQRTTRTEYISCPSCGRTLFDLEETTARIQTKTRHLDGVKIAVMGCIVNGPGEMADADFGYVGSGPGQVTLYVGREVVARGVPEAEATDRLVELIRDHGRWIEPEGREIDSDA